MDLQAALYLIAEVFRDQGDKDYIAARSAYRMNLREQFLWAALQACEKYLKAILFFNQRSADKNPKTKKTFGHDLEALFDAVKTIDDLHIACPSWIPSFLKYLKHFGFNRYLTISTYTIGDELRKLDETVWILRRYCQNFGDWEAENVKVPRSEFVANINRARHRQKPVYARPFGAIDGFLESVVKRKCSDFARKNLVWNNLFFAMRQRTTISYSVSASSENPPQTREWFTPALKDQVKNYVKLE